jgi:hypothetical protein
VQDKARRTAELVKCTTSCSFAIALGNGAPGALPQVIPSSASSLARIGLAFNRIR